MGLLATVRDRLRRKEPVQPPELPPRTYVFALNRQRFESWCHHYGRHPMDPNIKVMYTQYDHPPGLQGYRFRPQDQIVVLEDANFGHGWPHLCRETLLRSDGWVDLRERQETRI